MARRIVTDCDACRREAATPIRVSVTVGHRCGPGGTEDRDAEVDLCPECAGRILRAMVAECDEREGKMWIVKYVPGCPELRTSF